MGLDGVDRMQRKIVTPTLKVMIRPQTPPKAALSLALQTWTLHAILVGFISGERVDETKLCIPARNFPISCDSTFRDFLSARRPMYPKLYLTTPSPSPNVDISIRLQFLVTARTGLMFTYTLLKFFCRGDTLHRSLYFLRYYVQSPSVCALLRIHSSL